MRRFSAWLPVLLTLAGSPAFAGGTAAIPVTVMVDEHGNGFVTTLSGTQSFTGILAPDPGPGGLPSVLTYYLSPPVPFVAGDVLLSDLAEGGAIFDVIRFNSALITPGLPNLNALLFYSDNVDGFDALADTPAPPGAFYANPVTIPEVGPEGANGATYTPNPGQPGFVPGYLVTYNFISDGVAAVPEPASLALLGVGLLGLGVSRRRKAT